MNEKSELQKYIAASLEPATNPVDADNWNNSTKGILHSIVLRRRLVIAFAALGILAGVLFAILPRHYRSTSRLQVRPGSANQYRVDGGDPNSARDSTTLLESEAAVLESDSLLLDMAETLHLNQNADFVGKWVGHSLADADAREHLLTKLHKSVTITHLPRTEIINVSAESHSPQLSANIVNVLVEKYIDHLFQSRFASTKRVADWLSGQLHSLKQKVEDDQDQLVHLQKQLGIVGLDQNHDIPATELEDLTRASDQAQVSRIIAEARYRILSSGDIHSLEGGQDILGRDAGNTQLSLLSNLRNQRAQAESRYAVLTAQYGPKYPDVLQAKAELQTLSREVDDEEKRVLNQARATYEAAQQDERTTTQRLDKAKDDAYRNHGDMVRYQILLHDYESSRALYEGLVQRLEQAGIVSGLESSEVDVFDVARVASSPTEMNRAGTILIGGVLGTVLGIVLAMVLGQFDTRLQNLSEIESEINLPLLSVTPKLPIFGRNGAPKRGNGGDPANDAPSLPALFTSRSQSSFVESIWSLRTAISLSTQGHSPKSILLTSCDQGDGKSTFASGLALAFAHRNARVVLVEGNMRRPTLASRFHLSNAVGLSSLLTGTATLEQAIHSVSDLPGLSLLPAGPPTHAPVAILGSDSMAELMANLHQQFDVVIIDSPPALGLADTCLLAQYADTVVLVQSYANLSKAKVRRLKGDLARMGKTITGIALNFSPPDTLDYYGYNHNYYSSQEGARA